MEAILQLSQVESNMCDSTGQTAFIYSIKMRRSHEIQELLMQNEFRSSDNDQKTPLMYSIIYNQEHLSFQLLNLLKKQARNGKTALHYYIENYNLNIEQYSSDTLLNILIHNESQIQDNQGQTALMKSILQQDTNLVKSLIEKECCIRNNKGMTALMQCSAINSIKSHKIAEILLQYESKCQDYNGNTALMYAIHYDNKKVINLLVEQEKNIFNYQNTTPLMMAVNAKNYELSMQLINTQQIMMQNNTKQTALMLACKNNFYTIINYLLDEIEITDGKGMTALMYAAIHNSINCVQLLIKNCNNSVLLNVVDVYNNNALSYAITHKHHIVCQLLDKLQYQQLQNLYVCNYDVHNDTLLMFLCQYNNECFIHRQLHELGMKNKKGETALIKAVKFNSKYVIPHLLKAEHNISDNSNQFPIHYSIINNNFELFKILYEKFCISQNNQQIDLLRFALNLLYFKNNIINNRIIQFLEHEQFDTNEFNRKYSKQQDELDIFGIYFDYQQMLKEMTKQYNVRKLS